MSSSYFLGVWTVVAVLIVLAVPPWRTIGMNLLNLFKRTVGGWREDGSPSAKFSVRQLRGCLKSLGRRESTQHQTRHREVNHGLTALGQPFIVFAQAT